MDIMFNLPKLHPHFAKPDTHFVQESPPPFTIERRIRQRYHCEERTSGNLYVEYNADFPVLHQLPDLCRENARGLHGADMMPEDDMTMEEVERFERTLWDKGTDPLQFMLDLQGIHVCEMGHI